jgi:hypothetical protein
MKKFATVIAIGLVALAAALLVAVMVRLIVEVWP